MASLAHSYEWLPLSVRFVWECSIFCQFFVLVLLLRNKNFYRLPRFTAYVALNLVQAGFLWLLYSIHGISSATVGTVAWETEAVTLLAQAFATTEVLGLTLKAYRGIWELGWRALALVSAVTLVMVIAAVWHAEPAARLFELNRGYHLVFASAVIACLLLVRYYSIPVAPAYKTILGGFCFFSCTQILINTVIEALFQRHFLQFAPLWELATVTSFFAVQIAWAAVLWHALPGEVEPPSPHGDSTYQQLSPVINDQLRQLNDKLARLWNLEARSH